MRLFVLVAAATAALVVLPTAAHAAFSGAFASAAGVATADVTLSPVCGGVSTLTVVLTPLAAGGPSGTRSVAVKNLRAPDPCIIGCADCPFAWAWVLLGARTEIVGEGVSPGGVTMQGAFQEGVLTFAATAVG